MVLRRMPSSSDLHRSVFSPDSLLNANGLFALRQIHAAASHILQSFYSRDTYLLQAVGTALTTAAVGSFSMSCPFLSRIRGLKDRELSDCIMSSALAILLVVNVKADNVKADVAWGSWNAEPRR